MADDKSKRDYRDRTHIQMGEAYEVQYWTTRFGVTREQLKDAVKKAGNAVKDVQKVLHIS
jgi:benzoyl-CoA reductase/2-hydroxyglutaryl-CoA dehydratase subunit BcrC/BadD/HgdB